MTNPESAPFVHRDRNGEVVDQTELDKMAAAGNDSEANDTMGQYGQPAGGPVQYPEGSPWVGFDEFEPRKSYDYDVDYKRMNDTETPLQKQIRERKKAESDAREAAWGRDT